MARNANTHQIPKSQLVSTWLHEIPSDLESEGEETLVTPSVYEQAYPRRQKDEILQTQRQPKRQPKPEPEPEPELEPETEPLTPVRAAVRVPVFTPKQPLYPNLRSPARSPTRPQPQPQPRQNQVPNQGHNQKSQSQPQPPLSHAKPAPAKPSPAKSTSAQPLAPTTATPPTFHPLRDKILLNFTTNCTLCHPPPLPSTPPQPPPTPSLPSPQQRKPPPCPRCAQAHAYTTRAHHSPSFLTSHLLPISEVFSFDETVAYLNQAVVARLAGVLARGGRGDKTRGVGRTWPTLDDFDFVRGLAEVRRGVFGAFEGAGGGGGGGLGLDRLGMVRDRVGGR